MSYQRRKVRVGRVVGDKMDKTCIVEVEWRSFHRRYKKSIRRRSRFKAHDEKNTAQLGDTVTIIESRPTSKTKRWRLVNIVDRQEFVELPPMDIVPADEIETPMPAPVIEEVVSREEEAPVEEVVADDTPDVPEAGIDDESAEGDEGDKESAESEAVEVDAAESAEVEDTPADETSEPEEDIEETAESSDEEDTSVGEELEAEEAIEGADDDEETPAEESSEPEAAVDTTDDGDPPAREEEEEPEVEPAETPESGAEAETPTDESEPVDEKADEEKSRP